MVKVNLSSFENSWYKPGRGLICCALWYIINIFVFQTYLNPFSKIKAFILRFFGAKIDRSVTLKPCINIKYPWNIEIGSHSWIGEKVWLDSLDRVVIGNNVCISQGAYLCTGNHDWSAPAFGLIIKPIVIEDGAWIGAKAVILPGVTIATHSVVTAGSVINKNTEPYMIYAGNPAVPIKKRTIR